MNCVIDWGEDFEAPMNKRVTTYLPEGIYELLEQWATKERRSISNLTAFLLETAVREHYAQQEVDQNELSFPIKRKGEMRSIAELTKENFYQLLMNGKIQADTLKAIASGEKPSNADLVRIARILNIKEEDLLAMRDR
jgi:site-specific recombinase XerC